MIVIVTIAKKSMKKEYRNEKGQVIGIFTDDNKYLSKRHSVKKRHIFGQMDAWGIDADVINELREKQCDEIKILDADTSIVYTTSLQNFNDKAVFRNHETPQLFMSRKYWTTYEEK